MTMDPVHESPPVALAPASPGARPVLGGERIGAMDALRGVAVLGILLMNILAFALPFQGSFDPTFGGGTTGINLWIWAANTTLFEGKMRAIFSMLFGAGMLVLTSRLEDRGLGEQAADVYYRRLLWLLAFGLIHAYFIWWGDILFFYSVIGLFLFPLRRLSSRALIVAGVVLLLIGAGRGLLGAIEVRGIRAASVAASAAAASGRPLTEAEKTAQTTWRDRWNQAKSTEGADKEIAAYRGSYLDALRQRAGFLAGAQAQWLYHYFIFDIGGMMLIGIGLLKSGMLSARLSARAYLLIALAGYAFGVPIAALAVGYDLSSGFDPATMATGGVAHAVARLPVALAHVATVMLIWKAAALRPLMSPLAAVGQMAFSCYIAESLICTTLFYGYGLGWFARLERYQLYLVVAAVWTALLIASPLWLSRFAFGPLEWVWRSLTYLHRQPMRLAPAADRAPLRV
jgi:uncharacterized protein